MTLKTLKAFVILPLKSQQIKLLTKRHMKLLMVPMSHVLIMKTLTLVAHLKLSTAKQVSQALPLTKLPLIRLPLTKLLLIRLPLTRLLLIRPLLIRLPLTRPLLIRLPLTKLPLTRLLLTKPPLTRLPLIRLPLTKPPKRVQIRS